MRIIKFAVLLLVVLCSTACSELSDMVKNSAKNTPKDIIKSQGDVENRHRQYEAFLKSNEFKSFFAPYTTRERWEDNFWRAYGLLDEARATMNGKVKTLVDKNEEKDETALKALLEDVYKKIREAERLSELWEQRKALLTEARDKKDEWVKTFLQEYPAGKELLLKTKGDIEAWQKLYPAKAGDLADRFNKTNAQFAETDRFVSTVVSEAKAKSPDYAILADNYVAARDHLKNFNQQVTELSQRGNSLGRSYQKILVDMKGTYVVTVGRSSWDSYPDYPTEHTHVFKEVELNPEVFAAFDGIAEGASFAKGNTNGATSVEGITWEHWKQWAQNVNPIENWASGDNESEYYIEGTSAKYYHKYAIVEGQTVTELDWIEVDEDTFDDHIEHLGMMTFDKPLGSYEDEALTKAAPPGMSMVGDSKYGEWKPGPTGQDQWHWHPSYIFWNSYLPPNHYYYRNEYDDWNNNYRGRQSYYGKNDRDEDRYGSRSTYIMTNSRYSGSRFVQTGGYKAHTASVRGAAGSRHGGGPGGSGK